MEDDDWNLINKLNDYLSAWARGEPAPQDLSDVIESASEHLWKGKE